MFIEQLSNSEIKLIDYMRRMGIEDAINEGGYCDNNNYVDCNTFLRFWEYNKKEMMSEVFGEKLILKKKIDIISDDNEIEEAMEDLADSLSFVKIQNKIMIMLENYNVIDNPLPHRSGDHFLRTIRKELIFHMFSPSALIKNKYEGASLELLMPSGSIFKLVNGCKLMKAIGRLAKEAKIEEEFEKVRIEQSQIMNEAKMSSYLCLSIHPMDYITASYNNNNWHSCMNWEDGDYRRGVIEMMNSPFVIVAYLESYHSNLKFWIDGEEHRWNSKKWREFIIVSEEGIFGIKGYPFWNRTLEATALEWTRELFSQEKEIYSSNIVKWGIDSDLNYFTTITDDSSNSSIKIQMTCGPAMYNDFYEGNEYQAILAKNKLIDYPFLFDYSGESECVVCGECTTYFDSPQDLGCEECITHHYCAWCGDTLYEEDIKYYQGAEFCSFCYINNLPRCSCCDELLALDIFDNGYGDCEINEEEGISFFIEDEKTHILLTNPQGNYPITNCVCIDCAPEVFSDGEDELFRDHNSNYHRYYGNIIPIQRIKNPQALNEVSSLALNLFKADIEKQKKKSNEINPSIDF